MGVQGEQDRANVASAPGRSRTRPSRTPDLAAEPAGSRRSLVDAAYQEIKRGILQNVYPPSFQATEVEMANQLAMSRTPVREALLRLQAEGLVQVTPRRGLRVLPMYDADLREIYELLCCLEATAAEFLARRGLSGDSPVIREMEDVNERMAAALERRDVYEWAAMDERFHRLLVEHCGNGRICRVAFNVWDQSHRARLLTAPLRPPPVESYREHRAVVDAIRRGDERVAYEAHKAHRYRGMAQVMKVLEEHGLSQL